MRKNCYDIKRDCGILSRKTIMAYFVTCIRLMLVLEPTDRPLQFSNFKPYCNGYKSEKMKSLQNRNHKKTLSGFSSELLKCHNLSNCGIGREYRLAKCSVYAVLDEIVICR